MIPSLRLAWTLPRVLAHVVVALFIVAVLFRFCGDAKRARLIRWWSGRVAKICRVELRVIGPPSDPTRGGEIITAALRPGGIGAMLVLNHVSWLDIFIVHSLRPARFVAKAEIAGWPLLGYLTDRTGAIFIERGKRHAVREVNQRAARMLRDGDLIGMFPEGAVGDGRRLLPFHANLIQPAIDAGVPILVAGLKYRDLQGRWTSATDYVGDITMLQSIVRIARHGPLLAELHLIDAIDGSATTRHEVVRKARVLIADALAFDDDAHEAAEGVSTVMVMPDDLVVGQDVALTGSQRVMALDARDELL
ncbi:MAG: lysophospholipid acyltransferase family protein [Burkholderiaceae bacterium]